MDFPASSPAYMALYRKLPAAMRDHPEPSSSDLKSFQAYREWQVRSGEVAFPETELRNSHRANPDGSMGRYRTPDSVHEGIDKGTKKRDYSSIRVPVLAFFPSASATPRYQPKDAQERAAIKDFDAATAAYVNRYKKSLQSAPTTVRIVDLPGANHYVFLSNEADVLREFRAFLAGLRRP
jgi:non-heme chloroperoxidase